MRSINKPRTIINYSKYYTSKTKGVQRTRKTMSTSRTAIAVLVGCEEIGTLEMVSKSVIVKVL